ncbi:MAG: glycine cleavage T C-terminal barrel domain-containing protein [Paracoccaceae bacterium]
MAGRACVFTVDVNEADVSKYGSIWLDGKGVGFCTSGGYSHYAQTSNAQGFMPSDRIVDGLDVEIEILGQMCKARMVTKALFDPIGDRMRG